MLCRAKYARREMVSASAQAAWPACAITDDMPKAMPRTGDNALAIGFSLLPIDFFCMSDIMSLIEYERFQCPAGSMPCGQLCRGKRESGASPGRSGHCKRGEDCVCHCADMHEKAQSADDPQVRKPAENDWRIASGKVWCPTRACMVLLFYGNCQARYASASVQALFVY